MKIHLRGDSSWLRMCDTLCVDKQIFGDKIDVFVAIFLEMIHVLNSMCLRLWQVAQVLLVDFVLFRLHVPPNQEKAGVIHHDGRHPAVWLIKRCRNICNQVVS